MVWNSYSARGKTPLVGSGPKISQRMVWGLRFFEHLVGAPLEVKWPKVGNTLTNLPNLPLCPPGWFRVFFSSWGSDVGWVWCVYSENAPAGSHSFIFWCHRHAFFIVYIEIFYLSILELDSCIVICVFGEEIIIIRNKTETRNNEAEQNRREALRTDRRQQSGQSGQKLCNQCTVKQWKFSQKFPLCLSNTGP